MAVTLPVTVRQVRDDGSETAVDGELAAALAGPAEQFAGLLTWAAEESGFLDHGEREEVIGAASCSGGCCRPRSTWTPPGKSASRGHERRRDTARDRGGRARPGPGERLRARAGHADGLPEPA